MFCNLSHFWVSALCITKDSSHLLNYIFQSFFWIDICSVKGYYAIGYWSNKVFLLLTIFADSPYINVDVDFLNTYLYD